MIQRRKSSRKFDACRCQEVVVIDYVLSFLAPPFLPAVQKSDNKTSPIYLLVRKTLPSPSAFPDIVESNSHGSVFAFTGAAF